MSVLRQLSLLLSLALLLSVGGSPVAAAPAVPTLVEIRAAHHPGFDRIVFEFEGGLPDTHRVRYVDQLVAGGSGDPVRVAGRAILRVRFEPADAHDDSGATVAARKTFALPNILTAVRASDFEAVTTYGIGVARRTRFEVFTLEDPARVVIDIRAAFRTVDRQVYFFHEENFVDNTEPFFVPRVRPVPRRAPAVGALDRLFAGVLPSERDRGLRLLLSGATGYTDLTIDDGIARVRLTGGCSSGGSTVTIAGQIIPTLRRLAAVDWVKIYDPDGDTLDPDGPSDSVPECLEP